MRWATKLVPGLYDKSYNESLAAIKNPSMKYRRMRDDMILEYKTHHSDNQYLYDLFTINESKTRGYNFKIYKRVVQTTRQNHRLRIRVINKWNNLPYEVVNAVSLDSFKSRLDHTWEVRYMCFNKNICRNRQKYYIQLV